MSTKFNVFTGTIDYTGAGSSIPTSLQSAATETALPAGSNGDVCVTLDTDYLWLYDGSTSRWVNTGVKSATLGATPNSSGYSIVDVNVGADRIERRLVLQPADGTNPGVLTTGAQSIAGNKTFNNNVIVTGDLTVDGTTTSINTTNLEVEDQNILVNKSGNDASSEGAGLTVERTGVDGSIVYEDALASKWKAGAVGAEIQIVNVSSGQTLTNKTIDADSNTITNIENADIKAAAAIDATKIADGTVTSTEFQYINTLSSNAQTQINSKVTGPASATDNAVARYDSTTGKLIKDSGVIIDNTNNITGVNSLAFDQGKLDTTTPAIWGAPVHGLIQDQDTTDQTVAIATVDHANNSTNAPGYMLLTTGQKPGASSTGLTGPIYVWSGNNDGSGNSGEIDISTGTAASGNSGYVSVGSNASSSGNSGVIDIWSGNAPGGTSGSILLRTGTGATRGKIKFEDGSQGTAGHIWTSSDTAGNGYWAAAAGGGANLQLSNLSGTTAIPIDLIFDSAATRIIKTKDNTAATMGLTIRSGNPTGNFSSGTILVTSGDTNGTSPSGQLNLLTGTNSTANGVTGQITVRTGHQTFATGTSGSGNLILGTGDRAGSTSNSGAITITSGAVGNSTSGNTGSVTLKSGAISTNPNGSTGFLSIGSGNCGSTTTGGSGSVQITTGTVSSNTTGSSGSFTVFTGSNSSTDVGTTGGITLSTGAKTGGTAASGDINLYTGTATGTRGRIIFTDGSETGAGAGAVWTQAAADGVGGWAAPAAAGANQQLSNLASVQINSSLNFATSVTGQVKTSNDTASQALLLYTGNSSASVSGGIEVFTGTGSSGSATGTVLVYSGDVSAGNGTTGEVSFYSGNNSSSGTGASGAVNITTGNKTTGTGNSGTITLQTGTATGTRGKIKFVDGSQGTAGHVWTSSDTAGNGYWAAAAGGGANTSLSNLAATTAINSNLIFGAAAAGVDSEVKVATPASGNGKSLTLSGGASNGAGAPGRVILAAGLGNGAGTEYQMYFNFSKMQAGAHVAYTGAKWEVGATFTRLRMFSPVPTDTTNGDLRFTTADGSQGISAGNAATGVGIPFTISGQTATDDNSSCGTVNLTSGTKTGAGTGNSGATTIDTGTYVGTGTGGSGILTLASGNRTNAGNGVSGDVVLKSGDNSSSGTGVTGGITISTGAKTTGTANSGAINLTTGTATGTRGNIVLSTNKFDVTAVTEGKAINIWKKYTVGYAALSTAATVNTIELLSLPAYGFIDKVVISHSTAFSGGAISAYTVEVGITGNLPKYASAFNVFQATGNTVGQSSSSPDFESKGGATSIKITARSTGANLSAATAGSVDIWVLYGTMQ